MLKNERYTREIQRLREENAELKELYATYRERCEQMSVLLNEYIEDSYRDRPLSGEWHPQYYNTDGTYSTPDCTETGHIDNKGSIAYNGDINKGIQTGCAGGGEPNGK